ncbi:hypothetical protein KQ247_12415 [Ruegeria pomeroyi]|nr:hypothetical protein [Ruegeria pomeroyi]NVK98823.1 hypothetical protein [Ruegeria pomeroyi]NVL00637.1 hypothetical protein [Ruegeria pomeroyi]QWV07637.1 hypothetical protein KQ247_12415 [Ruegeria pomeroyi]HCE70192.1 hypothetical protein [Ruegeria sp.]
MKHIHAAALCGALFLAVGCAQQAPLNSAALSPGNLASGMPYYLPKSFLRVTFERAKLLDATIVVENRPDLSRAFVARAGYSAFSNDLYTIETTADGLLASVKVDTDEQSDEIVKAATSRVTAILSGEDAEISLRDASTDAFSIMINPFASEYRGSGKSLGNGMTLSTSYDASVLEGPTTPCPAAAAVCVPLLVPVTITIKDDKAKFEHIATVAHPRHVMGIRIDRRPCVRSIATLTFKAGMISKFDVEKPSEVAACLSIPLDVISAIIAAPVNALSGRSARLRAQKGVLEQQKALLEAQQALIDAQIAAAQSN